MNCFEVLEQLEKTPGKNDKQALLKANLETPGLSYLLLATFNYKWKYFVRDIPESVVRRVGTTGVEIISNHELLAMFESFETRLKLLHKSGRTQETKAAVINWLSGLTPLAAKWFRRAILRDLRCGFSVDSCEKAGFGIPNFELQLATDAKKCKKLEKIVKAGVWVSRKLDGNRCLAHGVDGEFTLYSRNGTVYENFPMVQAELARLWPEGEVVLDGEIMSDDFQSMQKSAFANKRKTCVGVIYYNVFDCIPPEEWAAAEFEAPYRARYGFLELMFQTRQSEMVRMVEHVLVDSIEKIKELQAQYEGEGFEGAMANPTDMEYYLGRRSNSVMKFKSMLTWDCPIIGFYEGVAGTRNEGRMGGFIVKQENGKTCEVGSGFSDEDRDYIWKNQSEFLGRIVECKYQELTPEKADGSGGKMRFPIFLKFRNFDAGEGKI